MYQSEWWFQARFWVFYALEHRRMKNFVRQMIVNPEEYVSVIVLITGAHNIFCILKQTNRLGEQ